MGKWLFLIITKHMLYTVANYSWKPITIRFLYILFGLYDVTKPKIWHSNHCKFLMFWPNLIKLAPKYTVCIAFYSRKQRAPVAYWIRELTLNPLGFSPLWFEPRSGHMWESQVLLTDGQVVFLRVLRFSSTFDERSARYKWNILERAVKPKSKKKKKNSRKQ